MDIKNYIVVDVQGFFTERFINICKMNNIKIWNIINITSGIIRFNIYTKDFKKLRSIARKTKCKVKIKDKKGIYFYIFKYRKRKWILGIAILLILTFFVSNTFVWNIEIYGNEKLDNQEIINRINKCGLHIGKSKLFINNNQIIKDLRAEFNNTSWVGLDILGTTAYIEFIEKVEIKNVVDERIGDVISTKNCLLTKVIAENGTVIQSEGNFVKKDMVVIKGSIYSEFLPEKYVHASGIVRGNVEYIFCKEYFYETITKNYVSNKYTLGISINDKENYINYLNKNKKYDKLKYDFSFDLFNIKFSIDWYKFKEYEEEIFLRSKEEILQLANNESNLFIQDILKTNETSNIEKKDIEIIENENSIVVKHIYNVNQKVGEFIERK